ncbi:uncharacterized protein LOC129586016 [Paramacrobiotus metropolitanus]|uniref:uncharacterized protein LOC129586016 n=1 Tax=Paramacrobiotus metropolitanus TaxID=2943436 RepID=UPI0024457ED5|nr:uncharacterized protein LOC129586016 [Paramacrobiotus metropolitanus]
MPRSLAELPKDLGISHLVLKGFFPYLFNTPENENYIGPVPAKEFFNTERMSASKISEFEQWYTNAVHIFGNNYNLMDECEKYCVNDVLVLRECAKITRSSFTNLFPGLDPFDEPTNPSAVMKAFQVHYLQPETIGILPANGYGRAHNQSDKAIQWMTWFENRTGTEVRHARKLEGELYIGPYPVDGFDEFGDVWQFYGCFWHGCRKCFPNPSRMNTVRMKTFGELREETRRVEHYIRNVYPNQENPEVRVRGFRSIWECDFDEKVKSGEITVGNDFRKRMNDVSCHKLSKTDI